MNTIYIGTILTLMIVVLFLLDRNIRFWKRLRKCGGTDSETGLPNVISMRRTIDQRRPDVCIWIHIDKYNDIMNYFGLPIFTQMTAKLATALSALLPNRQFELFRISFADFAILIHNLNNTEGFDQLVKSILDIPNRMEDAIADISLIFTITIGISLKKDDLERTANIALGHALKHGREHFVYTESLGFRKDYTENVDMCRKIREAIDHDLIFSVYQPIVSNHDRKIYKYEALMRIRDRNGTVIPPDRFLPIAKKTRYYRKISLIAMEKNLAKFSGTDHHLSINLGFDDISDRTFIYSFSRLLERYPCGDRLTIEILESESVGNYELVSAFIRDMRRFSCQFAIDDFGSGYSNFRHLLNLDIDMIKIDGTLIRDIDNDPLAREIVRGISDLAHSFSFISIAEYVHSEAVFRIVCDLGIDYSQGYYTGKPDEKII